MAWRREAGCWVRVVSCKLEVVGCGVLLEAGFWGLGGVNHASWGMAVIHSLSPGFEDQVSAPPLA
jgi:hypothetical protein